MAVIPKINEVVNLSADDRVIGVLLEREIFGDVRVRPTNVTASISSQPAFAEVVSEAITTDDVIGTARPTDSGTFTGQNFATGNTVSLTYTEPSTLFAPRQPIGGEFTVGVRVRVKVAGSAANAMEVFGVVQSNTVVTQSDFSIIRTVRVTVDAIGTTSGITTPLTTAARLNVQLTESSGAFTIGSSHTIPFTNRIDLSHYNVGDVIRISEGTGVVTARITALHITGARDHFIAVDVIDVTSPLTISSTDTVTVLLLEEPDTDYILLHNGPKGGFTQDFSPGITGDYFVNEVIKAVITE